MGRWRRQGDVVIAFSRTDAFLNHLGAILAILGPFWGHLGAILGPFWAVLGPSWGSLRGLTLLFRSRHVPNVGTLLGQCDVVIASSRKDVFSNYLFGAIISLFISSTLYLGLRRSRDLRASRSNAKTGL